MDEQGTHGGEELTLAPATMITRTRPKALWGALAAVVVVAGAFAVSAGGDDGPAPGPGLPVSLGGAGGAREASPAADSMLAWVTYVAGDGLPALGGEATAYRLPGEVDEATVHALAEALGMDGTLIRDAGSWTVEGNDGSTLSVYEGMGTSWTYNPALSDTGVGGSTEGSAGCGGSDGVAVDCSIPTTSTVAPTEPCGASDGDGCFPADECPPDSICPDPLPPEVSEPAPPVDLPTEDEARRIALDLLASTGLDVADAVVTVDGPYDAWFVMVEPRIDGLPSGLHASVAVDFDGEIMSAGGPLGTPERLGSYPLLDTRAAIDRLNALQSTWDDTPVATMAPRPAVEDATIATAMDPGTDPGRPCELGDPTVTTVPCDTPKPPECPEVVAPEEDPGVAPTCVPGGDPVPLPEPMPMPEPEPTEVLLTDATHVLVLLPAVDGSADAYLVPGYRFTGPDGAQVDAPAVTDDALTGSTPETTVGPTETTMLPVPDPGGTDGGGTTGCEPLVEEDSSGSTHTIQPCAGEDPQPERVDVLLHCVVITDWQGLWWTTEQINQPEGWVGTGTITMQADGSAVYVDDGAPDDPATFRAQGAADTYPGCD